MILMRDLVFVHVPKTGGTFARGVLVRHSPAVRRFHKHAPYSELPPQYRRLPVLSIIRNPWDWYVSWYHFATEQVQARGIRKPRGIWKAAAAEAVGRDFGAAVTRVCDFRDGLDLYSYGIKAIIPLNHPDLTLLRSERLREQLIEFTHNDLHELIRTRPVTRASKHAHYRAYYSPELRDLVGERAAWLCERFGYEF